MAEKHIPASRKPGPDCDGGKVYKDIEVNQGSTAQESVYEMVCQKIHPRR